MTWIGRPSQAFPPRDPYVTVFRHTALTTTHLPRKKMLCLLFRLTSSLYHTIFSILLAEKHPEERSQLQKPSANVTISSRGFVFLHVTKSICGSPLKQVSNLSVQIIRFYPRPLQFRHSLFIPVFYPLNIGSDYSQPTINFLRNSYRVHGAYQVLILVRIMKT